MFPATQPGAHFNPKGASRTNRASPQESDLPARSCFSSANQHPRRNEHPPGSNWPPITIQHTHSTQMYFCMRSLSPQQTRDLEKTGGLWEFSRICRNSPGSEVLVSTIVYLFLYLNRACRSSTQVPWPTCKTSSKFLATSPRTHFVFEQREQAGSIGYYYMHLASLPRAAPDE